MVINDSSRETKLLANFFKLNGKPLTYKKGRRLSVSDISDKVIYVKSGFLTVYIPSQPKHGRARAYYMYGPGDLMQTRELFVESRLELIYATLTNVTLYAVPNDVLQQAIHKNTTLAAAMLRQVVFLNELHIRRIENLSYRYASDKLTYRILNLTERFGVPKDGGISLRIPVTHRELGMFVNMARESVSREMEKLVTRGLISYSRQRITILDLAGLIGSLHEPIRTDWEALIVMANSSDISK
jgi:CRP/FNR family transcriptional regulator